MIKLLRLTSNILTEVDNKKWTSKLQRKSKTCRSGINPIIKNLTNAGLITTDETTNKRQRPVLLTEKGKMIQAELLKLKELGIE